ncbi:MAG: hypothetical protein H6981_11715 [Gammaproteobacteria bacterium]|nr:hypothetical protein [Gammaproteobacteria bacterium]MCP5137455.1 hypothetical protein [Gammaproteobacteria bacterium]
MHSLTSRLALPVCGALLWFSHAAQAAVVFDQGDVLAETDLLNSGTLVSANNLGTGAPPLTINGLVFGTDTGGITGMSAGGGDFSNQFTPSSNLDLLFSNLVYQYSSSSSLAFTGLTAGHDYFLQLFLSNTANSTGKASRVTVQGQQHNLTNFDAGASTADYLRVSFTASGTSELISFGTGSVGESARMVLNGYALSDLSPTSPVPTPAPLALLLLAAPLWRRRRHMPESG